MSIPLRRPSRTRRAVRRRVPRRDARHRPDRPGRDCRVATDQPGRSATRADAVRTARRARPHRASTRTPATTNTTTTRVEDEKPQWEPAVLGFAKNFTNTSDRNAAKWRQRLAPYVAPAVRDQLVDVDPAKVPARPLRQLRTAGNRQLPDRRQDHLPRRLGTRPLRHQRRPRVESHRLRQVRGVTREVTSRGEGAPWPDRRQAHQGDPETCLLPLTIQARSKESRQNSNSRPEPASST